jgi:hypothetical protein
MKSPESPPLTSPEITQNDPSENSLNPPKITSPGFTGFWISLPISLSLSVFLSPSLFLFRMGEIRRQEEGKKGIKRKKKKEKE